MGDTKTKALQAATAVVFDFSAPRFQVLAYDRSALARESVDGQDTVNTALIVPRAVQLVMQELMLCIDGGKMDRHDGQHWQMWLEAFEEPTPQEFPLSAVRWLNARCKADDVKLQQGMVQWREALIEYLDQLEAEATAKGPQGS